eukprot:666104-Alexandrium_andersonii.AAC.1
MDRSHVETRASITTSNGSSTNSGDSNRSPSLCVVFSLLTPVTGARRAGGAKRHITDRAYRPPLSTQQHVPITHQTCKTVA